GSLLGGKGRGDQSLRVGVIAARGNIEHRLRPAAKACCVPIVILLVIAALGPEKWAPRTHLGWQFDHFIGYFGITLFFCFAWPRPFLIGGIFAAIAALLEGLQAFTPNRSVLLPALFYVAAGALAAALIAELFIRTWSWPATVLGVPKKVTRFFLEILAPPWTTGRIAGSMRCSLDPLKQDNTINSRALI